MVEDRDVVLVWPTVGTMDDDDEDESALIALIFLKGGQDDKE